MSWHESVRTPDRLDGHVRKEHPEQTETMPEKRQRTVEPQVVGGQTFPPSLPHPATLNQVLPESIPVPSSGSSASSHGVITQVQYVHDSCQNAIAFSTAEEREDFVLCTDHESDQVLLAGMNWILS